MGVPMRLWLYSHCHWGKLAEALRKNRMSSCGCYNYTKAYKLHEKARVRARRIGVPFDLDVEDVVIPTICPLLGINIEPDNKGKWTAASPTLDRKVPELGYVKGNVWVVSHRANLLKNNATTEELEFLVRKLREYEIK